MQLTLRQHGFELHRLYSYTWRFSNKYTTVNAFSLRYGFLKNILFFLAYSVVKTQHIIHIQNVLIHYAISKAFSQ